MGLSTFDVWDLPADCLRPFSWFISLFIYKIKSRLRKLIQSPKTVVTKRIYSHNPLAQAAVLLILFTVCNLLFLFYSQAVSRLLDYLGVSPTRQLGVELLRTFLVVYAYCEYG